MPEQNTNMPHNTDGDCENYRPFIKVSELACAYVPEQLICNVYKPEQGFKYGTLFPELNKPYSYERCHKMRGDAYDVQSEGSA